MRFLALFLPALALCLGAPACKRRLTDANLGCVRQDMSEKEVESILGQPNRVQSTELPLQTQVKTLTAQRYYYDQQGKTVVLHFIDGKLAASEGSFEK